MAVMIGQRRIDLGEATEEQTEAILQEVLRLLPEPIVLTVLRDWLKENGLEGELD